MVDADGSCGCEMKSGVCFYNPNFIVVSDALSRFFARCLSITIKTNVKILWRDSDSGIASISIKATCFNVFLLYFVGVFPPDDFATVRF